MSKVVFVGDVPYNMKEEQLVDVLKSVGRVVGFGLVRDIETGASKGYGFCEYSDHDTAVSAVQKLKNTDLGGIVIHIIQDTFAPSARDELEKHDCAVSASEHEPSLQAEINAMIMDNVPFAEHPPPKSNIPGWLHVAVLTMRTRYTEDIFEVVRRNQSGELRIKCLDCPGKLYTPGPGETVANFEVHLRNRQHRQRVNDRTSGSAS